MDIVKVYQERIDGETHKWTSQEGFAVVEETALYVTKWDEDDKPIKMESRAGSVLFHTSAGEYEGGYQACEAFIKGYDKARPMEPIKFTSIGSCS